MLFRSLTAPDAARGRSLRDALVEAWRREIFAASGDDSDAAARAAATERLFAGAGGVYSDTQVALRAEMFSSIEGAIHSIARDVELANRSLVRVLTTALPTATTSPAPPSPPPAPGAVPAPPR